MLPGDHGALPPTGVFGVVGVLGEPTASDSVDATAGTRDSGGGLPFLGDASPSVFVGHGLSPACGVGVDAGVDAVLTEAGVVAADSAADGVTGVLSSAFGDDDAAFFTALRVFGDCGGVRSDSAFSTLAVLETREVFVVVGV